MKDVIKGVLLCMNKGIIDTDEAANILTALKIKDSFPDTTELTAEIAENVKDEKNELYALLIEVGYRKCWGWISNKLNN